MILVIGYGNPLRSDDAIGQHVAWEMIRCFPKTQLLVRIAHQLTPELAEIVSHFDQVVFIDARVGDTPGEVVHEHVRPNLSTGPFTHHVTPATLLGAANSLYGSATTGILISVVGAVFEYGVELSPQLSKLLPDITQRVTNIIRHCIDVEDSEAVQNA